MSGMTIVEELRDKKTLDYYTARITFSLIDKIEVSGSINLSDHSFDNLFQF